MPKIGTIGILAGMGPRSTAPFLNQVLDECQKQYGAKNDMDFPHIIIYSLPTPFYVDKPIDHEEMKKVVCEGLKKLEAAGVDFIAIPCNTVHKYFEDIKKSVHIPVLNIVDETIKSINLKSQKITLLATRATMQAELYQTQIQKKAWKYEEKEVWQKKVDALIKKVKAGKTKQAIAEWKILIRELEKAKINTIIIACTDLSLFAKETKKMRVVDSSSCLAKAVIEKYRET